MLFTSSPIELNLPPNKPGNKTRGTCCLLESNRCRVVAICLGEVTACHSEEAEIDKYEDEDEDNICRQACHQEAENKNCPYYQHGL